MIFSSPEFILLFTATLAAYLAAGSRFLRSGVLLASSFFFLSWAGEAGAAVFFGVVLVSWAAAAMGMRQPHRRTGWAKSGIALLLVNLAFWKYSAWVVAQAQLVWPGFLGGRRLELSLPAGISFYTLQGIAYLADFAWGGAPFMGLGKYLLFQNLFAKLIAGPIVRARQLGPQLDELRRPSPEDAARGLALFTMGIFKKLVLADRTAVFVDAVFADPAAFPRLVLLEGALAYSVQIWADFSGYTDMARGSARMLGLRLPENFLSPYLAKRPSEFWQRWHVTLSLWIRDYLYLPLGGVRSVPRALAVAMVSMAACGIWHGAGWTFLLWGLYHGGLIVVERLVRLAWPKAASRALPLWLRNAGLLVLTQSAVVFGWVLFRSPSLKAFASYAAAMAAGNGASVPGHRLNLLVGLAGCAALHAVFYRDLQSRKSPVREAWMRMGVCGGEGGWDVMLRWAPVLGACFGAALALAAVASVVARPVSVASFIYFRF